MKRRRARLLASLILAVVFLGSLSGTVQLLTTPGFLPTFLAIAAAQAVLLSAYLLTRRGRYYVPALLTTLIPGLAVYASLVTNPADVAALGFLLISVVLSSLLLDRWSTAGIAAANLAALLILPVLQPGWAWAQLTGPISYHIIIPALILLASYHRDRIEQDRQQALRRSEERFALVFNTTSDFQILLALGSDGGLRVEAVNQSGLAWLGRFKPGLTERDLVGQDWAEVSQVIGQALPGDLGSLEAAFGQAVSARAPLRTETSGNAQDDGAFYDSLIVPVIEADGSCHRVLWSARDITDRKRSELALQESELKFRSIFDRSLDAIGVSQSGVHILVNPAYLRMFGFESNEQLAGAPILDLIAPSERARIRDYVRRRPEDGTIPSAYETRGLRRDGTEFDMEARVATYAMGSVLYTVPILRDITERKQSEARIRYQAKLLDSISEAIIACDLEHRVASWNQAAEALYGWRAEDVLGRPVEDVFGDAYLANTAEGSQPGVWRGEAVYPRQDGTPLAVFVSTTTVTDEDGRPTATVAIHRDLSDRKRMEAQLQASEARYQLLADNLPDSALLLFDQEFRCLAAAGPQLAASGLSREALTGRILSEALPVETVQQMTPNLRRALAGEKCVSELFFADQSLRLAYVPLPTPAGQPALAMIVVANVTQLRLVETALKESQRRLSTALRVTKIGVWEWDIRTNRTYWSDENYRVMGLEPGSVESRYENWARCVHPEDLPAAEAKVAEAISRRGDLDIEFRVIWPDGSLHWINDVGSVLVDEETQQPLGMYGVQIDITERRQIQQELVDNRRRLAFLLAKSPAVVYSARATDDFGATFVSENVTSQLGYASEEFVQNPRLWMDNVHPEDAAHALAGLDRALETGMHTYEYRFRHKDGRYRWMLDDMNLIRDEADRPLEFIGAWVDITERKQMEALLFEEKERAEVTLHSIGDAVITTDVQARVQYLNPVAERLTGWRVAEALGRPLSSIFRIIDEFSRQPVPDPVEKCLRSGQIVGLDNHVVLINRDGTEFGVNDTAAPIRDNTGRLIGAVLVFHDVSEARRLARQIAHDATHDALTGLVNRREFELRVQNALVAAQERGMQHSLCYLDLDQFKIINDAAGHAAGDALLMQLPGLLGGLYRLRDTLARLGGDEFGLLLENCPPEHALGIANEIVAKIRDYVFVWGGRSFQIGVSIGIVPITVKTESVAQLLSQADVACYTAKDLGRGRVYIYQPENSETSQRYHEIVQAARLREAVLQNQFQLYGQVIVPLRGAGSAARHYEVLLRLVDEDGQLVAPAAFIPPAERYGLMASIDRWVIAATFRFLAEHKADAHTVTINLSGNSLNDEQLLAFVQAQFEAHAVLPGRICFEITETATIHNLVKAQRFIGDIRAYGCKVALDDFGSGLSSFRYLKSLSVDYLKIDGSFVRDMLTSPSDRATVEAINQVAHTLGIQTIAEHVTDQETAHYLRELGVDYAQGFGLGRPMPLAAVWNEGGVFKDEPREL